MVLLASALLVAPAFMLFSTLAKDATDISQPLSSMNVLGSTERPIATVVRMLKDMEDELETRQDDDTAVHDKLACWCDTNRNEKTAAIEQGETNDAQLQAFIGEALAIIQELQVTRKDARDELYADQKSFDEAKAMRLKEHKDFHTDAIFLNEAIDAAGQVVNAIGDRLTTSALQSSSSAENQFTISDNVAEMRWASFYAALGSSVLQGALPDQNLAESFVSALKATAQKYKHHVWVLEYMKATAKTLRN